MADWIRRLKAALTPQLVLLLLAALALIGYCTLRDQTVDETTRLEKQASAVLSRMEGAGRVEVTIMTRKTQMGNSGLLSGKTDEAAEIPWEVLNRCMNRIINEVKGVNRVVYDLTSKPPGTIEFE